MTIYLVACTQQKLQTDVPVPAADLYMPSQWFKKARAAAEALSSDWYVLSAGLGLVDPTEKVLPYNSYLGHLLVGSKVKYDAQGFGPEGLYLDEWVEIIAEELLKRHQPCEVVILASKVYAEALAPILAQNGFSVQTPLKGLGIGDQKKVLGEMAQVFDIEQDNPDFQRACSGTY